MSAAPLRPPWAARLLLRLVLWGEAYEAISGDLEEELATEARPRLGAFRARLWYWRQSVHSILAFYRLDLTSPRTTSQGEDGMLRDLAYGIRMLRKSFGFTAAAVVTLGLGIGAVTATFSVVHTFLVKPLPYADPSRVAFVLGWNTAEDHMNFNLRFADFADLTAQSSSFSSVAAYRYWSANLTGGDRPERVQAYRVTANVFELLGVEPAVGRTFAASEGADGGERVAVLSHGLWQRRFGGDRGVVGRGVTLDGESFTVIGVMPPAFEFPVVNFKGDLWVPLADDPERAIADRTAYGSVVVVARLGPGVSAEAAQAEVDGLMARLAIDHPATNAATGARVIPMGELLAGQIRPALVAVFAAVVLVLLLACANVASLLLVRAAARGRELAVRAALGAGTGRLVRQLLTECLLLAAFGGALGVIVAFWTLRALSAALPEMVLETMPGAAGLGLDGPALAFALAASAATGVLFGLVPALRAARSGIGGQLREGSRGSGFGRRRRFRQVLVAGEVALSLLLLVVTGLLLRSFGNMLALEPGFEAEGVLTFSVSLPESRYGALDKRVAFFERLAESVGALPGVASVGVVNTLPFSTYNQGTSFLVEGRPEPEPGATPRADYRVASPGYLETLGVPVLQGRGIRAGDRAGGVKVALVNRALAERYFPGESPVGRRLRQGRDPEDFYEIVGVVGDVRHWELTREPNPEIYVPLAVGAPPAMMVAVRTAGSPDQVASLVREAVREIDSQQPVFHVKTLEAMVAQSHLAQSAALVSISVFAAMALVLAALGLYGVIAYTVSQSTREIGIRMALGARSANVVGQVLGEGMALVAAGSAAGLAGAWGLTRFLSSLLYGVAPHDPATFLAAVPVLAAAALAACLLPARRASRVDPVMALRAE